ncbi:MAG TPA: hypothetical protein VK945_13760 [Planococcus sp. (in: firmicutes)]|nr:hypothetical protein [Planococcus sp. (in: firmicutes)]
MKKYAPLQAKYAPQTQKYDSSPQNATKTAPPETTATRSDGIDSLSMPVLLWAGEYAPLLAKYAPIVKKYAPLQAKYAPQTQKYDSSPQNGTKPAPP